MKRIINFCRINEEYGFLSNFSNHSFSLKNKFWRTSEHYFQTMKFATIDPQIIVGGIPYMEKIRLAKTPSEAARFGRATTFPIRSDWEQVKEFIMEDALMEKFTQNPDIKKKLIETGDAILVEHRKADRYWGDGGNGSGKNRLGVLLMKVRSNIGGY